MGTNGYGTKLNDDGVVLMWDFWTAILFLFIALPVSLFIMALLGWADSKQQNEKHKQDRW